MENVSTGFPYGSGDAGTLDFSCQGNLTPGGDGAVADTERQRHVPYGQEATALQRETIFSGQEANVNSSRSTPFDLQQFPLQYQGASLQPFANFPSSTFSQMGVHRPPMSSGNFPAVSTFSDPSTFIPSMPLSQVQQQARSLAGLQRLPSFSSVASSVASSVPLTLVKNENSCPPNMFPGPSSQSKVHLSQKEDNENLMHSSYPATSLESHIHPSLLRLVQQQELSMSDGCRDGSRDATSPAVSQSSLSQFSQHSQNSNFSTSGANVAWASGSGFLSQTEHSSRKLPADLHPKNSSLKGGISNPSSSTAVALNMDINKATSLSQDYVQRGYNKPTNIQSAHSSESDSDPSVICSQNNIQVTHPSLGHTQKKLHIRKYTETKFSKSKFVNESNSHHVNFLWLGKFGDQSPWRHQMNCEVDDFEEGGFTSSVSDRYRSGQWKTMFQKIQTVQPGSSSESSHLAPHVESPAEYKRHLKNKILQNYEAMRVSNASSSDKHGGHGASTVSIMGKLAGRSRNILPASASEDNLQTPIESSTLRAEEISLSPGIGNESVNGVENNEDRGVVFPGLSPGTQRPFFSVQPEMDDIPVFSYDDQNTEEMRKIWKAKKEQLEAERLETHVKVEDSQCILIGDQKRWQCQLCPKNYTTKHNLVTHILDHSGIKPHLCMICGKYFKQLSHLNTHLLTHNNIKPHVCFCGKGFTQVSHLKRHQAIHQDNKPHICDICSKGFMYPSELRVHKEKHIPGRDKCVDCGEDFASPKLLKQHQATHDQREELTCTECTKVFRYPSQLRDHLVIHTGSRPFICTECGLDFMKEHHLKAHMFTHTGLRPFNCLECGRTFNQKANLQRHMLIHSSDRSYKCDQCDKTFTQPQTLKAHMVVHAEKKPYWCDICGKEFGRLHNLQGHMHMHNNSKPYVCFCGSSFTLKGNLNRHKKVKHGLNESTASMEEEAVNFLNFMSERVREEKTPGEEEDEDLEEEEEDDDDDDVDVDATRDSPALDQSEDSRSHRRERKSTPRKIPRQGDSSENGNSKDKDEGLTSQYFQPLNKSTPKVNSSKRKRNKDSDTDEETRALRVRRCKEEDVEVKIKEEVGDESLSETEKENDADVDDDEWMPDTKWPMKRGANLDSIIAKKFQTV